MTTAGWQSVVECWVIKLLTTEGEMNIGELKEAIENLPDDMELVGEFSNNQDDVWWVGLAKANHESIFEPVEIEDIEDGDRINFLIRLG